MRRSIAHAAWVIALAGAAIASGQPAAQPGRQPGASPGEGIERSPAVQRLLDASYLSEEEAQQTRVYYGAWTQGDLAMPALRARAALQRGALGDASLLDESVDPLIRAEAMVRRGEPERAIGLVAAAEAGDARELTARSIRARALVDLGRFEEAKAELDAVGERMMRERVADAEAVTDGIEGLILRQRLFGAGDAQRIAADFRAIMRLIAQVRQEQSALAWPVRTVEAELLHEKHSYSEAQSTAREALRLNPGAARAWALLGEAAVDGFALQQAEAIANQLDGLARSLGDDGAVSIEGAMIRARARLRQRDADGALEALAPAVERFPTHRGLIALHAAAAALDFDDDLLADRLAAHEALAPGSAGALFVVGSVLSEARQYDEAAEFLSRAHERMPAWAEPVLELGMLAMQSGEDERALVSLEKAVTLDPFHTGAANSLTLIRELLSYETVSSEHFVVRSKPGIDGVLAREMLPVLERIHARVAGDGPGGIDFEPDRPTVIELMPDHQWFSVRITGMPAIHTMAAATGPVIAMETPREGPRHLAGAYDWARVVQHEYAHTVTLARTRNRIPHWFTEAAAVYLEDGPRPTAWIGLLAQAHAEDRLFDLDQINLAFVRPEGPNDRTLAYAQGHWMYEFIVERFGARAPLELMDRYAEGVPEREAFEEVLGVDGGTFLREFRAWAGDELRAWGVVPDPDLPTMDELLGELGGASPEREQVERWLAAHPEHPGVLELAVDLATAPTGGEMNEEGAAYLERLAAIRVMDPSPRRALARFYLRTDAPSRAIPHLEWLDAREQSTPAFAAELARRHAALGAWEDAGRFAERASRMAPFDADYREFAATIALKRGDYRTAERHIEALIALEPDRPEHPRRLEALHALTGG